MAEFQRTQDAAGTFFGGMTAALLRDAQTWTGLQCELLSGMQALWTECARRQSEVIEGGARSAQRLLDGRHFVEIAQLQRDWLASAARRTADAAGKWAVDGAAWSREATASAERAMVAANESVAQPQREREAAE